MINFSLRMAKLDSELGGKLLKALEASVTVPARLRQEILGCSPTNPEQVENLSASIVRHIALFAGAENVLPVLGKLDQATGRALALVPKDERLPIDSEAGLVMARRAAINLAAKLGFGPVDRTKVATAVSELARNIVMYARPGELRLLISMSPRTSLTVEAIDNGPGIPNVDKILAGGFRSTTGLGMGLRGIRSIASEFSINSGVGQGTRVRATFVSPLHR